MKKKILVGLAIVFAVIQFIRPTRNHSEQLSANDITLRYQVPDEVQAIIKHSCYDCHSNNTTYPYYFNVQPVGWWLQSHVNEAKHHLNFSEFGSYTEKKAKHEFEEIEDAATNGWMPLTSYTIMHSGTKLTAEQSKTLAHWASALK
jgi:Haem-binding domain